MKFIIGNLYTVYLAVNKKQACQWRVLSAENLKSALSIPVLMTKGPRWNTHAIIGTLGPFSVQDSLALDLDSANRTTSSWIAVVYSFPGYETITSLESNKTQSNDNWASLGLKPGKYSLGLRYYNCEHNIDLPAVKVDNNLFVNCQSVPKNVNDFYRDLIKSKNWFYLGLHYYIFTLLRLRKWLPESFVKREYLPVGATDTEFFYNYMLKEQVLQVEIEDILVNNYDIYLTIYDRSSLPVSWHKITESNYVSQAIANNGFYLIRMRPKFTTLEESLKQLPIYSEISDEEMAIQKLRLFGNHAH